MTESYLMIYPSGELSWVDIERKPYKFIDGYGLDLDRIHQLIGCDCLEQVRTILPNIVLVVDESGRVKYPPQQHNMFASRLYYGYLVGLDDIVGPALVCSLRPIEPFGEMDWGPLSKSDLLRLSLALGLNIPDQ